ncbi:hypothetical protein HPB52_011006 [Rhipicephalus sanguineus]|uniref:CCHC-type domain-containing protein n=1 Tax=Rhipicephalus sanguineus TaxID=34632 RepID=A0A9D4QEH8_RHISA|nr:hypothetical protein HPB52_011006 [Rhipicephalus sanguineus]
MTSYKQTVQNFLMQCAERQQPGSSNPLVFLMMACSDAKYLDGKTAATCTRRLKLDPDPELQDVKDALLGTGFRDELHQALRDPVTLDNTTAVPTEYRRPTYAEALKRPASSPPLFVHAPPTVSLQSAQQLQYCEDTRTSPPFVYADYRRKAYIGVLSTPSSSRANGDRVAATQSNIASAEAPQGPVSTPRYRSVALPTLQVPTYAGDLRQWQEFWDHYSATIHNNIELPPIEKFNALEGLGVPPEQYTVVLHRVLMRCLPEDLAIMYRQKKKEESTRGTNASAEPTPPEARTHKATDILAFLKIQVEVREEGKQAAPSLHPCHSTMVPDDMNSPTRSAHAIPPASALVATESLQQRTLSCVLCNSRAHSLAECTAEMSVEEKKARLRYSRCCYRCGTRNHVAQFCRVSRNFTCNKCRRRHLTVLCELSRAVATTASPRTTEQLVTSGTTPPTVTMASTGEKGAKKHDAADLFDPETWHPDDISILIGSDAYWKFATGSIDRLSEGLTAVETSFGWTVQGTSSPHEAATTCALLMSAGVECDESARWRLGTISIDNWMPKKTQELDMLEHCLSRHAGCYQEPSMITEPLFAFVPPPPLLPTPGHHGF